MQHIQIHIFCLLWTRQYPKSGLWTDAKLLAICQEVSTETEITYLETDKTSELAYSFL